MHSVDHDLDRLLARIGRQEVRLVASGTAALEMALEVLEIGPGDEVIVPDVGSHSVGAAAARRGAKVVFVGVGETLTLSRAEVQGALTESTRAVIGVHQYGLPCDIRAIRKAVPREVAVIEDFAQAWGLVIGGEHAGSLGDLSVISFGPTKPLTLGAGGAVFGPQELLGNSGPFGLAERMQTRLPSGARFAQPLLSRLPVALSAADRSLSRRRRSVHAIVETAASLGYTAPEISAGSDPAWTRLPLYSSGSVAVIQAALASLPLVERIQVMHEVPPSGLPMFQHVPIRVIDDTRRTREPLLIVPSIGSDEA